MRASPDRETKVFSLLSERLVRALREKAEVRTAAVLVDIDGTVLTQSEDIFYNDDEFIVKRVDTVCELVMSLHRGGCRVVFLTARSEEHRRLTEHHLAQVLPELSDYELYMRPIDNEDASYVFKSRVYKDEIRDKHNVLLFLDDDFLNVEAISNLGVLTAQC